MHIHDALHCKSSRSVSRVPPCADTHSIFKGSDVTIIHQTDAPYEAAVYATSGSCTLRGLKIAHRSPSVANNYAVFVQGASLALEVSTLDLVSLSWALQGQCV